MVKRSWNLNRLAVLRRHQARFGPPVYRTAALYTGMVTPEKKATSEDSMEFEQFMAQLAPQGWG
jgi:hypothetical protein